MNLFSRFFSPAPATFADIYPAFYKSREAMGMRPWTLSRHRNFGKHLIANLGKRQVARLTRADYLAIELQYGNHFMEGLRCFVNWSFKEGFIPANAMPPRAREPLRDHLPPKYMTPSEAQRYYAAMEDAYKPALALMMFAGLRPMEACRMDWGSIHVAERRIRVEARMTKVRRPRVIEDIPTIVWAQLALFEKREGALVPGETDFAKYEYWQRAKQAAVKIALVKLAPNVFRHSFATYFVALTGSTARAAKVLGHTKLDMLARHYDGVSTKVEAEHYFHPKPILALPWHGIE
jgi:integrase